MNMFERRIRERFNAVMINATSVKWKIENKISHYSCSNCKISISVTDEVCKNCNSEIKSCLICKLPIKGSQKINNCPNCNYTFHTNHWDFWMTSKGSCPNCKHLIN
jgi:hypothetical protein